MKKRLTKTWSKTMTNKIDKPDHISHNQIQLGRCPLKYETLRLKKELKEDKPALTEGSIVHDIIYEYTKACVEQGMDGDFELMNKLIEEKYDDSLPQDMYLSMREYLLIFAQKGIDKDSILDYERDETVTIGQDDEGKPIKVQVKIDRVNTYRTPRGAVVEVLDYKNQMNIIPKEEIENNLQLRIYRYVALQHLYPWADYIRVGIYHTRYNWIVSQSRSPVSGSYFSALISRFQCLVKNASIFSHSSSKSAFGLLSPQTIQL